MNLTPFQQEKLKENKAKIFTLIQETELIIGHDISGISFTKVDYILPHRTTVTVAIKFELEDV